MQGETDFTLEEVVGNLSLARLSGGGWGRVMGEVGAVPAPGERVSAYRLLTHEAAEDWRAVEVEELWTAYMGAALALETATETGVRHSTIEAGSGAWARIPAGGWLRIRPLGDWCLAGRIGPMQDDGLS
ncbi:cupin domain-containing protein [Brevundimonas faecalis]|uniref:Cupin superfamily sugar epimerase n=1 Tax=Brevundimonas faecalis TaxID=947378 RepID=A0ABV2REF3_9CAUL